jgi:protein-S-isoprenylcysteine O-methyltransferase Ste14
MPFYAYAIVAVGSLIWFAPFVLIKKNTASPQKLDPRARWGILLVVVAYTLLWQNSFWARPLSDWRIVSSLFFFMLAGLFSWTGARALGRQWRIDAGLNEDHQLVRSGPYRIVRHPIYTSMLCLLLGTGSLLTPVPILLVATALFMAGTEIRVRIEDTLLASHFGEQFQNYRNTVPAYIPFLGALRRANAR